VAETRLLLLGVMKPKARIERWVVLGNIVVGYLYDYPGIKSGTRVKTEAIVEFNPVIFEVRCIDGDFKLGEPGTVKEHQVKMLGGSNGKNTLLFGDGSKRAGLLKPYVEAVRNGGG